MTIFRSSAAWPQSAWSWSCLALCLLLPASADAQVAGGLVSQQQAASVGLKRAWFARAEVNPARSSVVYWILSIDQLLIVTDAGVIQSLDANTGATQWVTQFGNPNYPSLGPAANDKFVAVINGSTLCLLDRHSGRILTERPVGGAPGAGPALSNEFVFVPTINGLIEGYPLDLDVPGYRKWFYQSRGRTMVPALVTPESLAWTTDAGYMYVGGANTPGVRFRLETRGEFDARPAYRAPLIYAVSTLGETFAVDERLGILRWKYSTGFTTDRAPAAVGDRLFVTSEEPMLHCVDASTGLGQWHAAGVSQFAAVTKSHVYGVDRFGTLHILNVADGALVGRVVNRGALTALVNDQTDRLFLISASGLVQCLHEIGADEPTYYVTRSSAEEQVPPPTEEEYQGDGQPAREPAAEPQPESDTAEAPAGDEAADEPFGAPAEGTTPPADESDFGVDDNPFD